MNTLEFGTKFDWKITGIELDSADTNNFLKSFLWHEKMFNNRYFFPHPFYHNFLSERGWGEDLTDNFVYQVRAGGIFLVNSPWKEM